MSHATCKDAAGALAGARRAAPAGRTARGATARGATARGAWPGFLLRMVRAIESRRQLAAMDDRMLSDIGISRADALREAGRRPWDLAPPRPDWDGRG